MVPPPGFWVYTGRVGLQDLNRKELQELKQFTRWGYKICPNHELPIYRKFEELGLAQESPESQGRPLFHPTPTARHAIHWSPAQYDRLKEGQYVKGHDVVTDLGGHLKVQLRSKGPDPDCDYALDLWVSPSGHFSVETRLSLSGCGLEELSLCARAFELVTKLGLLHEESIPLLGVSGV